MRGLFQGWSEMSSLGILGMNKRNISYISQYNPRERFPLVDDKLLTKNLAIENGINTPKLVGVIERQSQIRDLQSMLSGLEGFCVKPAKGSGGKGILALRCQEREGEPREDRQQYLRSNGEEIGLEDIERHTSNILAGLFSLGGKLDVALIEGLIQADRVFKDYSFEGVPDIRIIVFRGVPVMAMIRLSCRASLGKANLHQGAVGVGLDMASGKGINAVQADRQITHHPDTGKHLMSIQVPMWRGLLQLACGCYEMSGLGYLGVDLVLDHDQGPILLELNARPGLSIQIANNTGLLPRLNRVESLRRPDRMTIDQRIDFCIAHF